MLFIIVIAVYNGIYGAAMWCVVIFVNDCGLV